MSVRSRFAAGREKSVTPGWLPFQIDCRGGFLIRLAKTPDPGKGFRSGQTHKAGIRGML